MFRGSGEFLCDDDDDDEDEDDDDDDDHDDCKCGATSGLGKHVWNHQPENVRKQVETMSLIYRYNIIEYNIHLPWASLTHFFFRGGAESKPAFWMISRKYLVYLGNTSFQFVACNLAAIYQWIPVIDP